MNPPFSYPGIPLTLVGMTLKLLADQGTIIVSDQIKRAVKKN